MLIRILMKTLLNRIFLICLFLESISGYTQNLAIGEWRIEVPYNSATNVTIGKDEVFCAMNTFYAGHVLNGSYTLKYETLNGLSDIDVSGVYYYKEKDLLFVAYDNANIDLIEGNTVFNISDIKRATTATNKRINEVFFYNNIAYLSCAFGIVVVDLEKKEIKESYFIGVDGNQTQIFATTVFNNKIFTATALGVQVVDLNAPNLINYQFWEIQGVTQGIPQAAATDIITYGNEVLAVVNDSLYKYSGGSWSYLYNDTAWIMENISVSNNKVLLCERKVLPGGGVASKIKMYDGQNITEVVSQSAGIAYIKDAVMYDDTSFYVADFFEGLKRIFNGKLTDINPNSISTTSVTEVAFAKDFVWIATGDLFELFNQRGLARAQNNFWYNLNQFNFPILNNFSNLYSIKTNPANNHIFVSSFFAGILELDAEGNFIDSFTIYNSTLENRVGNPRCQVGGLVFDEMGNLWATNFGANRYLSVKKPDGTWKSFKPTSSISSGEVTKIIIDDSGQKWMINPSSSNDGIVVFRDNNTLDDESDDIAKVLRKGVGVGNLPNNEVLSIAKDLDGEIWVGTIEGLVVFYCASSVLTENGCDAQEILVTSADGFVGALLGTERIQAIAVDGANRKWVGTSNGLWLFSPDGTQQIEYFTTANSPLLSNNITSLTIEPQSGVLYVGTDKGLLLYRSDATEGNENIECKNLVFPNPVRENYFGPIAISCLPQNADIKITDVAGNLVYKTIALGGQAIWDGRHPNGEYARAGVYLVLASNEDGSSKQVSKILVMR
jgi:hypothetical protein